MKDLISRALLVVKKHFLGLMIFSVVFVAAFCACSYANSFRTASAVLSFRYPNASDGLYPNGTYFNAYNILTPEVIEAGIRNAGLEGRVDPFNLMDEITIRPMSDASLITTQYVLTYDVGKDDDLGAVSAEGLLDSVLYAYIDHFHETYSNDQIALNLDETNAAGMEYIDLVDYYDETLIRLQKYIRTQQDNNKDFVSDDGTSFQDLLNIIEQYRLTALTEIRSIITERGVTNERAVYTRRLNYRIWNLTNSYDYNRKLQQLYKTILQDYEARLTSVVFIPSLDSERKFYMSKTKVGIDIYALNATDYEESAEEIHRQIKQTERYISKIVDSENTRTTRESTYRVYAMIAQLKEQLNDTMNKIRLVEKEFSQYKNHNYVTTRALTRSFRNRSGAKKAVVLAAALDAVIVAIPVIRSRSKKGKETN